MSKRLLIIDDDRAIAQLTAMWVTAEGFSVQMAHDGASGLALAEANPPAAVLLDIRLPDTDGYEVCRRIRAHPVLATTPVVFMTASVQDCARREAAAAGGTALVTKPIENTHLREALKKALDRPVTIEPKELPLAPEEALPVLIVDDDDDIVRMLAMFLGSRGYTCRAARTGAQGIIAFGEGEYSMVITDLNMPAGDGVALIERIRRTSSVPVLIVTAFSKEYAARLRLATDVTVLQKPFDSSHLLDHVEAALKRRQNRERHREAIDGKEGDPC